MTLSELPIDEILARASLSPDEWMPARFSPGSSIDLEKLTNDQCTVAVAPHGWLVFTRVTPVRWPEAIDLEE